MSLIRAQEMEIILHTLIVLELGWIANSFNVYEPARVPGWNYFGHSWVDQKPSFVFRKPMAAMVDLTNDLGVAILQDYSYSRSNFAFSPYGVASVLVVLYEGARGESARQIHRAVRFPWDKDITRIGFRDIHRHLRSYFSHEGYLSGITLSKDGSSLKPEYKRILRFYGYDVDVDAPERTSESPMTTTERVASSPPATNSTTPGNEMTTTAGYDVTMVKDTEETNIAASTLKPGDITTSSSGETMTTLTILEDRESPVSPTTMISSNPTTETVVETTETSATATSEEQNSGISPEQNTQETNPEVTEQSTVRETEEDVEQSASGGNEQDAEQGTEESTQGSSVQDTQQSTEGDEEQSTQQSTEGDTDPGTPGGNEQDTEHSTQGNDLQNEEYNPVVTEQDVEQVDQQILQQNVEQSTQGSNMQDEGEVATEQNAEQVDQQTPQLIAEQSTPGISITELQTENEAGTEQSTEEGNQQNAQSSTEENTEQSGQQNTEESTPEGNQQNTGELGTETTPSVTPTEDDSAPVTTESIESLSTRPTTEEDETTISADEVEEITVSTPTNIEEVLATLQEAEVAGNLTTEEGDRSSRSDALDNGMLIPQYTNGRYSYFDDRLGLAYSNPEKRNLIDDTVKHESTSEDWREIGVALIAEGDEVKWEPKTLDEFLKNLMQSTWESPSGVSRARRLAFGKTGRQESPYASVSPEEGHQLRDGKSQTRKRLPVDVETSAKLKRRHSTKEKRNISEFVKVPPVTDLSLQLQNGMFDSHVSKDTDLYRVLPKFLFLVDGAIDTPVPMMTYTNVFPFAYIPRLHCKALEFPLDDERYKLLILLPVERRGLRQLIYDLGSYPLREVMDVLRPARVKAMVPTFMVEGFVILTPTLQKMGIWDVFDPRRADLSGMTSDPDLYVRNIEQSVTVVIRNYVEILDIQTRTMAARHIDEDFIASHPFLYFVMDTATNVALMAGQMLDPLNSRIY